jgi:UDP-N-acetyl-D-mannosaminuronic acid dehydrogenase
MTLPALEARIADRKATIGVIGLGYVGLPVAAAFAAAGFDVLGIDVKADRVDLINQGRSPIDGDEPGLAGLLERVVTNGKLRATTHYDALRTADVVLVDVETPVDDDHQPRYQALQAVCRSLGPVLQRGALVIVESTIAPGTIDRLVAPLLQEAGAGELNEDFYLGACPERVMPGLLLHNLRHMSRVCGGSTPETAAVMVALYRHIVGADLDTADPVTAELVKTAENAYRDVQIAFANEVALICEASGGDVWQVRELVNKSPGRNMLLPGAGVGGHCIPKDPWLLAHGADGRAPVRLIPAARAVNDAMPGHMAQMTAAALAAAGISISTAHILVLGYAYLENSDDTRNSPSAAYAAEMEALGATVCIHDPWVSGYDGDVLAMARGCDAAVLLVAHDAYCTLDLAALKAALRTPLFVAGRHLFDGQTVRAAGLIYRALGEGQQPA